MRLTSNITRGNCTGRQSLTSTPIFTLRYNAGLKGVFEGQNRYHNVALNISKRVYLSQFGFADVTTEGGYIFGKNILFPLLSIHRANQTYAYQLNSYNLMNFLEFVSDHYASLDVQYYMNGFIFNKIPLLKKLKLREVFSFKGLVGGLRDENNPGLNPSLYRFPVDADGKPISYTLSREPYIEGSVGIANIFKLLRVDWLSVSRTWTTRMFRNGGSGRGSGLIFKREVKNTNYI
jgi:hypothetical protein